MGCDAGGSRGGGGGSSPSMNTLSAALPLPAFTSPTKSHNGVLCCLGWLRRLLAMLRAMWGVEKMVCVCVLTCAYVFMPVCVCGHMCRWHHANDDGFIFLTVFQIKSVLNHCVYAGLCIQTHAQCVCVCDFVQVWCIFIIKTQSVILYHPG